MKREERQARILSYLSDKKVIKSYQAMEMFQVSMETIRRDFEELESRGVLRRNHGGAVINQLRSHEIEYENRELKNLNEKHQIGMAASRLINDGETIVMNSGTTVMEAAKNLWMKKDLTVITNCVYVAMQMQKNESARIFLVGGELRTTEMATSGYLGNEFLSRFRADKAIIGIGGIDSSNGITDYHIEESYVWRDMVKIAEKTIVVADYSKFGVTALNVIANIAEVDFLVTDRKVPVKELNEYRCKGVEVIIA